jgi:drug/metabolite transporter (DMT)-like permease
MLNPYLRNKNAQYHDNRMLASLISISFGSALLYIMDKSILVFGGCKENLGMVPVVSLMNMMAFFELFVFMCMILRFFSHCLQKRRIDLDILEGTDHRDTIIRLFISVVTILTFLGTAAALSYTQLNTPGLLIFSFFAGMLILSFYYIACHYKNSYKKRPPILLILRHELGVQTFLSMVVMSIVLASISQFPPKHFELAIGLALGGLFLFIVAILVEKIDAYFNSLDEQAREEVFKQQMHIGMA